MRKLPLMEGRAQKSNFLHSKPGIPQGPSTPLVIIGSADVMALLRYGEHADCPLHAQIHIPDPNNPRLKIIHNEVIEHTQCPGHQSVNNSAWLPLAWHWHRARYNRVFGKMCLG